MQPYRTIARPVYELAYSGNKLAACNTDSSIPSATKSYHAANSMLFPVHAIVKLLELIRHVGHSTLVLDAALAITPVLSWLLPALCNHLFSVGRLKTA